MNTLIFCDYDSVVRSYSPTKDPYSFLDSLQLPSMTLIVADVGSSSSPIHDQQNELKTFPPEDPWT